MQNKTKKYLGVLSLGIMLGVPGFGHAAFSSISRSTYTAVANLNNIVGTVAFNAVIRNVSNDVTVSTLSWTVASLPYTANGGWKLSDQYIKLDSTFTVAGGGIQIYTDNGPGVADAAPFNLSGTPTKGGLVDSTDHATVLSVAWWIQYSTKTAPAAAVPGDALNPTGNFSWVYILDHGQTNFVSSGGNSANGITAVANDTCVTPGTPGGSCIQFAQASFGGSPSPNSVFVQANFTGAFGGRTYGTQTLRLEAFTQ